jgi:hypothetical protein
MEPWRPPTSRLAIAGKVDNTQRLAAIDETAAATTMSPATPSLRCFGEDDCGWRLLNLPTAPI